MSHPKIRQKCQAPLLKITGVISGVGTPKDKTKAMSSPLTSKKRATRMITILLNWGYRWGCYTQRQRSLLNYVPYVLMCQRALRAHVSTFLACSCANESCVLTCQRFLRALVPFVLTMPCVLTCSRALRAYVLMCYSFK